MGIQGRFAYLIIFVGFGLLFFVYNSNDGLETSSNTVEEKFSREKANSEEPSASSEDVEELKTAVSSKKANQKIELLPSNKVEKNLHPSDPAFDKEVLKLAIEKLAGVSQLKEWENQFSTKSKEIQVGQLANDQVYIDFEQKVDGIPVRDHVIHTMTMKTSEGFKVVMAEGELKKIPQVDTRELVTERQALVRAREATRSNTQKLWKNERVIREMGSEYRAVREIQYLGNDLMAVVDTVNGKTIIEHHRHTLNSELALQSAEAESPKSGSLTGAIYGFGTSFFNLTDEGISLEPLLLPHLAITIENQGVRAVVYTNKDGGFDFPVVDSVNVRVDLTGKFFEIVDGSQARMALGGKVEASVEPIRVAFNQKEPTEFNTAQVNAYSHANKIRDYLIDLGMDNPRMKTAMPVRVNLDLNNCNAAYGAGALNFFVAGDGCVNSAYDTVVYHEYGHFIDDVYGGIVNSALSEGWGDALAILLTDQPEVGQHFRGPGTNIRSADNTTIYDETLDCGRCIPRPLNRKSDPHLIGEAWAGFVWKLRTELAKTLSQEGAKRLTQELVMPSLKSNARSIPQAVREVALRDDDDGNLENGTRHWAAIVAAASAHGLDKYLK